MFFYLDRHTASAQNRFSYTYNDRVIVLNVQVFLPNN